MILIKPYNDRANSNCNDTVLSNNLKSTYRSLADILDSVNFRINEKNKYIDLEKLNLSKDYNIIKVGNYRENISKSNINLNVSEINITTDKVTNKSFSKKDNKLLTLEEYRNMNTGTELHEILELIDLKNPDYSILDNEFYVDTVKKFLDNDITRNIKNAKIYKEYEFIYEKDNIKYHGIIDLMLEYDNHIDIIDYKLKNVLDDNYIKQLNGYKDYIKTKTNKDINLYLYSLLEHKSYAL